MKIPNPAASIKYSGQCLFRESSIYSPGMIFIVFMPTIGRIYSGRAEIFFPTLRKSIYPSDHWNNLSNIGDIYTKQLARPIKRDVRVPMVLSIGVRAAKPVQDGCLQKS